MPYITLTFSAPLNESCQVGDTAYYVTTTTSGGFSINSDNVTEIGQIRQITNPLSSSPTMICNTDLGGGDHGESKFILFSKDNKANLSSVLGYYASVKFVNNSNSKSELFTITADAFESSK